MNKIKIVMVLIVLFALSGCKKDGGSSSNGSSQSGFSQSSYSADIGGGAKGEAIDASADYLDNSSQGNEAPAPIPEPGTLALLAIGLGGLATKAFKKKFIDKAGK